MPRILDNVYIDGNLVVTGTVKSNSPEADPNITNNNISINTSGNEFVNKTTKFLPDGSIEETLDESIKLTKFLPDGTIQTELKEKKPPHKVVAKKLVKFLSDGSIKEEVVA